MVRAVMVVSAVCVIGFGWFGDAAFGGCVGGTGDGSKVKVCYGCGGVGLFLSLVKQAHPGVVGGNCGGRDAGSVGVFRRCPITIGFDDGCGGV